MLMRLSIKSCRFGSLLLACLLMVATDTHAIAAQGDGYYDKTKDGWFWYEDPPPELEPLDPIDQKETVSPRVLPSLDNYEVEDLWNMYPDDFQELLNVLQKKAVQNPTEQNIMEYLTMQDIARRKALAYTSATMYVTQKRGDLFSVNQVYPTAAPGISARVQMQNSEISKTINDAGYNHALIFFVSPGCGFCEKQVGILAYFKDKYGWPIKTIDITRNTNAASRFNVTVTPSLLLAKKGQDNYMTVSTGVITMSELERKLYRAIRYLKGNTGQKDFLMYDFQKDSPLDPESILNKSKQPWKKTN